MGYQREIAIKIVEKGGDNLLAVKENLPTLHQQVRHLISDAQIANDAFKHINKSYRRTVMQRSWVAGTGKKIDSKLWLGCKTVGCVVS